jgi:hypothetical protein
MSTEEFLAIHPRILRELPTLAPGVDTIECSICQQLHALEPDPKNTTSLIYVCQGTPILVGIKHPKTQHYHDVRTILPPGYELPIAALTIDDNTDPNLPRTLPELMGYLLAHWHRIEIKWRMSDGQLKVHTLAELPPHEGRKLVSDWLAEGLVLVFAGLPWHRRHPGQPS